MGSAPENQGPTRDLGGAAGEAVRPGEPGAGPAVRLAPGDLVGRYRLVAPLGVGGMGEVWRAMDDALRREVAVKLLHPPPGDDRAAALARARFTREAQVAASLRHANLVVVHDVGEAGGRPFLVMDLERGRSLRAFVGDPGVSLAQKVRWLREVAAALAVMHRAGVVHRDVKPENVVVREDGAACLVDFGIAKWLDTRFAPTVERSSAMTADDVVVGTPDYLPPEARAAGVHDARGDQYAWGVLAYEVLTGAHPVDVAFRSLAGRSDLPGELAALVERAMAKRADGRFPGMDPLVAALDRAAQPAGAAEQAGAPGAAAGGLGPTLGAASQALTGASSPPARPSAPAPARSARNATTRAHDDARSANRRVGIFAFFVVFATGLPLLVLALGQRARRTSERTAASQDPPRAVLAPPAALDAASPDLDSRSPAPPSLSVLSVPPGHTVVPAPPAAGDSGAAAVPPRLQVGTDWVREHPELDQRLRAARGARLAPCFPPVPDDCKVTLTSSCRVVGGRLASCAGRGTGSAGPCPDVESGLPCMAAALEGASAAPLKEGEAIQVSVSVEWGPSRR